ncbi:MAG: substrate-binding domain-containing protein [ANME-2 cluster archaeon]|nr:substrate-binding domain-containing protein [ANME-2 cluster archaeon]
MNKTLLKILLIMLFAALFSGCIQPDAEDAPAGTMSLSTTTSTCDTGLLDVLNARFEEENNVKVLTLCQGTGKAIATGEMGAADVVLVHAPSSELKAMERGSFIDRQFVMYNYFVIIGPASDPANVTHATSATDAFTRIADAQAPFISRGDNSGTHTKELGLWNETHITPQGIWYQSVGKGMGDTIITADIKQGYTLSDRGTYLAMKDNVNLVALFENDQEFLYNPYHVMAVSPEKFPDVNYGMALNYIEFLTSDEGQGLIQDFGLEEYGQPLFIPAHNVDEDV